LEDIAESIRPLADEETFDPANIDRAQERLAAFDRLRSKYGKTFTDIMATREALQKELDGLATDSTELEKIETRLAELRQEVVEKGKALEKARKSAAKKLADRVNASLKDLSMERAVFSVAFEPVDAADPMVKASAGGLTAVDFMVQTNPGEPAGALGRIASGGELSRMMLALKEIVAQSDRTSVLVFDEIDSSVGPRLGKVIADKLSTISQSHQVVCITHLGQIASRGAVQFKVVKAVEKGRTFSRVVKLEGQKRIEEIAEMIGGHGYSEHSLKEAEALLAGGVKHKGK
jgi:DNA repair protein RecN (Recombination protein N)